MTKFRCENCETEFSIGDDIYDMVMIHCPCCGDIYSNPVTDGWNNYIRFGLEETTIHLKTPDEINEEKEKLRMAQDLVRNIIKDGENYESEDKNVSHPSHYQSDNGIEVIDVIEAFTKGLEGIEATDTGNVIKYICRWKNKNGTQDLEKAMWYLQHLLNHVQGKGK